MQVRALSTEQELLIGLSFGLPTPEEIDALFPGDCGLTCGRGGLIFRGLFQLFNLA
jgi:hypothetical protein